MLAEADNAMTARPEQAATLIVGLGKSGLSVARFLARRGEAFAVADSRATPPGAAELAALCPACETAFGAFDAAYFARFRRLIVSPGVAVAEPAIVAARAAGAEIIGDIELFARAVTAPVIAITGSNGKSTVTTLVGEMAAAERRVAVGGNLGTPALDLLEGPAPDLYVLELSSFQLETTGSLAPAAATVLNLSADHLDRYDSIAAYAQAKARIYANAAVQVINRDDPVAAALATGDGRRVSFGLDAPADGGWGLAEIDGEGWLLRGTERVLRADDLRIRGRHNVANALAALALGEAAGLSREAMCRVLRAFPGLPHRSQWVATVRGADWINDSKGTNVGATLAALNGMTAPVVLLAGGLGKDQDFTPLRPALAEKGRALVLFGRDAGLIAQAVGDAVPVVRVDSMEAAVAAAAERVEPGDVVLLSPACASFDMFTGYEERGQRFVALVNALGGEA